MATTSALLTFTGGSDIYVRDRQTGVVTRESYGIGPWVRGLAFKPSISADGRFVAFEVDLVEPRPQ